MTAPAHVAPVDVLATSAVKESLTAETPHGLTEVTRDAFWSRVMSEKRNVQPVPERYETNWVDLNSRHRWGWTSRGWLGPFDHDGAPEERFALANIRSAS